MILLEKAVEWEPRKLRDRLVDGGIEEATLRISAACTRVPVRDDHLECVSAKLEHRAPAGGVLTTIESDRVLPRQPFLPSALLQLIVMHADPDWPQLVRDRNAGRGTAIAVGRLGPWPLPEYRFVLLGHNTAHGAAGGSILTPALLAGQGYLPSRSRKDSRP